jgi:hypothetical protein
MIKIGINKWEAINWVQDHLGPATPRNIAEDTLKALVKEGLIETAVDEVMLIEDLDQDGLRRRARNTMITKDHRRICRTAPGCKHHAKTVHHEGAQQRKHMHDHMNVVQQGASTILVDLPDDDAAPTPSTRPRKR